MAAEQQRVECLKALAMSGGTLDAAGFSPVARCRTEGVLCSTAAAEDPQLHNKPVSVLVLDRGTRLHSWTQTLHSWNVAARNSCSASSWSRVEFMVNHMVSKPEPKGSWTFLLRNEELPEAQRPLRPQEVLQSLLPRTRPSSGLRPLHQTKTPFTVDLNQDHWDPEEGPGTVQLLGDLDSKGVSQNDWAESRIQPAAILAPQQQSWKNFIDIIPDYSTEYTESY
ncbi:uncharacterized protein V6R79_004597 [Siganus canaliculatus]